MARVIADRMTADAPDEIVVFLIGMRVNRPWKLHKWWPVARAMPRMLRELDEHPELGLLHYERWVLPTPMLVQYWRDMDSLMAYARSRDAEHLPAWRDFNRRVGSTSGDVGIWHETYRVRAGDYETVYGNMPLFGLARAWGSVPARGRRGTAAGRLGDSDGSDLPAGVEE